MVKCNNLRQKSIKLFAILIATLFIYNIVTAAFANSAYADQNYDISCKVGETVELKALIEKINSGLLTSGNIKWTTSDSSIATVNGGKVYGVKQGYANITASVTNEAHVKSATITVYVQSTIDKVQFVNKTIDVRVGEEKDLQYQLIPKAGFSEVYLKKVSLTSKDGKIASISGTKVKGVTNGTVEVTITSEDGKLTDVCTINVHSTVTGVSLNNSNVKMAVGEKALVLPIIQPSTAYLKTVKFTSSDTKVASVSGNGEITGNQQGSCKVTVTTTDGNYTASCDVVVLSVVGGITLDKTELSLIENGAPYNKLNVAFTSDIAGVEPKNKNVNWASSDGSVAAVSGGVVTPKKRGTAVITATSVDGGYKATCAVTVGYVKVESVKFSEDIKKEMYCGESATIAYTILPTNATSKNVKITGSFYKDNKFGVLNGVISQKSSDWVFQPKVEGTYKIDITTEDGGLADSITISVKSMLSGISIIADGLQKDEKGEYFIYQGQEFKGLSFKLNSAADSTNEKTLLSTAKWASSDGGSVSVNGSSGLIKGLKFGKGSKISVTADDNGYSDSINVNVKSMVDSVQIVGDTIKIGTGAEYTVGDKENQLRITVNPKGYLAYGLKEVIDKSIKLKISDEMIPRSFFVNSIINMQKEIDKQTETLTTLNNDLSAASDDKTKKDLSGKIASVKNRITALQKKIDEFNKLLNDSANSDYISAYVNNSTSYRKDADNNDIRVAVTSGDNKIVGKTIGKAKLTVTTNDGGLTDSTDIVVDSDVVKLVLLDNNNNVISGSIGGSTNSSGIVTSNSGIDYDKEYLSVGTTSDKNKVWKIKFTEPVKLTDSNCIIVTDSNSNKVSVKVEIDSSDSTGKTIKITPQSSYKKGDYYIYVTKYTTSTSNEMIKNSIRMKFTVK